MLTVDDLEAALADLRKKGLPGNARVRLFICCKRRSSSKRRTIISYDLTEAKLIHIDNTAIEEPDEEYLALRGTGEAPAYPDEEW